MVLGLFPRKEQETVVQLLEKSVIFLTPQNIDEVLHGENFHQSAWMLANLYLLSVDAEPLGGQETQAIVGTSGGDTCHGTMRYFDPAETRRFDDFVVHECAHVFHNWKRSRCGLPFTRYKEWLLPIAYVKRETFAYACETFSRILALSGPRKSPARRRALLEEYLACIDGFPGDSQGVDHDEYQDILLEAVTERNSWKRILKRCEERSTRIT